MAEEQQVELDLEGAEETVIDTEDSATPEKQEEPPSVEVSSDSEPDEFQKAESNTQKRIDRLTKKMREAQRREEEALRYAKSVQEEAEGLKRRMDSLDTHYVNEYESRVTTQMSQAEQELARAMELGDTQAAVAANKKIASLAIENDRLSQAKIQQEQRAQVVEQPQPVQQQPQQMRRPDPKAEDWAQRNEWFGQDEAMTFAAFGIHKRLVENEGFDPNTDEYYTEVDKRIRSEFPHKFQTAKKSGGAQVAPAAASATRSTAKQGRRSVKLSPSQIAMAKRLNVPLEEYAKYVKD